MNIRHNKPIVAIITPCYNEEEVLPVTAKRLFDKIQQLVAEQIISEKSSLIFVDDGSSDNTWSLIEQYHVNNPDVFSGIKLSGNKGHQNALLCGLLSAKKFADATISIDADLQDDIDVIDEMITNYCDGYEIVYGVRADRDKDSFFKKTTAQGFYRCMHFLGAEMIYNHADFRLIGKHALCALAEYQEVNLFLRGIVPMLGYKSNKVYYSRKERFAGTSKYPMLKMIRFAFEGITSFSIKPIHLITILGLLLFAVSIVMVIYFAIKFFAGYTLTGWASIACSIWGIGGLILFSIGIVGEYIGKVYLETKNRPRFHIEKLLFKEKDV